jgi:hypothetical protein
MISELVLMNNHDLLLAHVKSKNIAVSFMNFQALSIKWPKQIAEYLTYFQVYLLLTFSDQIICESVPGSGNSIRFCSP